MEYVGSADRCLGVAQKCCIFVGGVVVMCVCALLYVGGVDVRMDMGDSDLLVASANVLVYKPQCHSIC